MMPNIPWRWPWKLLTDLALSQRLGKSVLLPLTEGLPPANLPGPFKWVTSFKYLDIMAQKDLSRYLHDNLYPILQQFNQRCSVWKSLPLTPVGSVHFIKMTHLPKFLYIFCHTPVSIPKAFFTKLNQTITTFIWVGPVP